MICSKCGEAMRMTDKDTSSGRDIREYTCDGCGHSDWEDNGTALWKVLSDSREADEANLRPDGALAAQTALPSSGQAPAGSWWKRLHAWLDK